MNIYRELISEILRQLSGTLSEIFNPGPFVFFSLLPAVVFVIAVKLLKPKRFIFRIGLILLLIALITAAGYTLTSRINIGFGGGFFFIAVLIGIVVRSIIILVPFCGGVVLRGREKYYTLLFPALLYFAIFFSNEPSGNIIELATPALVLVPILYPILLYFG